MVMLPAALALVATISCGRIDPGLAAIPPSWRGPWLWPTRPPPRLTSSPRVPNGHRVAETTTAWQILAPAQRTANGHDPTPFAKLVAGSGLARFAGLSATPTAQLASCSRPGPGSTR